MTREEIIAAPAAAAVSMLTDEEKIRGRCPLCGAWVRSQLVYQQGRGYLVLWRCDNSSPVLPDDPTCEYMRVL